VPRWDSNPHCDPFKGRHDAGLSRRLTSVDAFEGSWTPRTSARIRRSARRPALAIASPTPPPTALQCAGMCCLTCGGTTVARLASVHSPHRGGRVSSTRDPQSLGPLSWSIVNGCHDLRLRRLAVVVDGHRSGSVAGVLCPETTRGEEEGRDDVHDLLSGHQPEGCYVNPAADPRPAGGIPAGHPSSGETTFRTRISRRP
jgi:hypothetical protein